MGFIKEIEIKVKKLRLIDIKLAQLVAFFVGVIVAKLFPGLYNLQIRWLLLACLIAAIKPVYTVWFKK